MCFFCDQIYRSAASGVKMCHKRLIIRIDCYKNTFGICFSLENTLTVGQKNRTEITVIQCVYYGSEWGAKAKKEDGDPALRACFEKPEWNDLTTFISRLAEAKKHSDAWNTRHAEGEGIDQRQMIFV